MMDLSAELARSITFSSSKQSYYTARLLVDNNLRDDCLRAYAYLRWVDDVIDEPGSSDKSAKTQDDPKTFIRRQRDIVERLYQGEIPEDLTPDEIMVADLIRNNPRTDNGLHSFICNFLEVLEFDAIRKGRLVNAEEFEWYSLCLGKSVTDGIQYFIGNGHPYPHDENRYLAATAAHITHMLRDLKDDLDEGFVNIPRERLEEWGIKGDLRPQDFEEPYFQNWVSERVQLARNYIRQGKNYLDSLEILRCKIAGYWYTARFEFILDAIERDGYNLRRNYRERNSISAWLKIAWLGASLTIQHVAQRFWSLVEIHRNIRIRKLDSNAKRCRMIEMNW